MAGLAAALVTAVLIGGSVGLSFAICGIINWRMDRTEAKRKQAHPDLWVWFEECDEAGHAQCVHHNSKIAPLKRKVDAILSEWNYYTEETKSKKEIELEELRKDIEAHEVVYAELCEKTEAIRTKIHNYVEENDLGWAREWGW